MKKQLFTVFFLITVVFRSLAQNCDPSTPVFNVDLSGQPNGTWISPAVQRVGNCCGTSNPDRCIQFNLTLDSTANLISFNIYSGAVPGGSMFYQINCGPPQAVGQPVCLSGVGPHIITFCKPGNNTNQYSITSIGYPSMEGTRYVSQACQGTLAAVGLDQSTIQWTSVPNNPLYNSYLSCSSGCDTVVISPTSAPLPAFIDYQVCGFVLGGCNPFTFCDTIRVNFVNDLDVTINPANPTICFGGTNATLTANGSGGLLPYSYLWSTGETTQSVTKGPGTYSVELFDQMNCSFITDTVTVTALPSPISAYAGPDGLLCMNNQYYQLNGTIVSATGGMWVGNGIFSPSPTDLNPQYTPDSIELTNGLADLQFITTGNSGCPGDTDQIHISIVANPVTVINGVIQVCLNDVTQYSTPFDPGSTYLWTLTGGTIINSSQNIIDVLWNTTGSHQISVAESNGVGCDSICTITVNVMPKPGPVITGTQIVCSMHDELYSIVNPVPGSTYQWSIMNGSFVDSTGTSVIVDWQAPGLGSITVTETNTYGCDSVYNLLIFIFGQPAPVINGPDSVCNFQNAIYSVSANSTHQFIWTVTGGNIISQNNNTIEVFWTTPGAGFITVNEINQNICDSLVVFNVYVKQIPAPVITGSQIVCSLGNEVYSILNPATGSNYQWSMTSGSFIDSLGTTVIANWQIPGNGTITVTETNMYGCDSTVSLPVNIIDQPTPVISGPDTICNFQSATYTTNSDSTHQYFWSISGGNIISQNNNSVEVLWTSTGSGFITVNEVNQNLCDSLVLLNVYVLQKPTPVITGPTTLCSHVPVQYQANVISAGENIQWYINGGIIQSASDINLIDVLWQNAGVGELRLVVTNPSGCDSIVTFTVNVLDGPAPDMKGPTQACKFDTCVYNVPFVSGHSYQWQVSGGNIIYQSSVNSATVYWQTEGAGMIMVNELSSSGCDSSAIINVLVNPKPLPLLNGVPLICENATSIFNVNPTSTNTYEWSITGGTIIGGNQQSSVNCMWSDTGNYSLILTERNQFGCTSVASMPIVVAPLPNVDVSGNSNNGCLNTNSVYVINETPGTTYQYSVSGGTIVNASMGNIQVQWTNLGSNSLTVNAVNNTTGCNAQNTLAVMVEPVPQPVVAASTFYGCPPLNMAFANNPDSSNYHYTWNFGDGTNSALANPDHIFNTTGFYQVNVLVTNNSGCRDSANGVINVFPTPLSGFNIMNISNIVYSEFQDVLLTNSSTGAVVYSWNFGNGDTSNLFEPDYIYRSPGNYDITLDVINMYGCRHSTMKSIEVIVPEEVYVPNTFTPNGDATNDYFSVAYKNITTATISIFDRWGEKIYETDDLDFKWNGLYKGRRIQDDVYVYLIKAVGYHGTVIVKSGKLTVLY